MCRVLTVVALAWSSMLVSSPASSVGYMSADPTPVAREWRQVVHMVDGDTVDVLIDVSSYRARLIGIDAAEIGQPCFEEAAAEVRSLVEGRSVCLDKDVSETDRYGW